MVAVAQLVRALVCGSRGRGFKSPQLPTQIKRFSPCGKRFFYWVIYSSHLLFYPKDCFTLLAQPKKQNPCKSYVVTRQSVYIRSVRVPFCLSQTSKFFYLVWIFCLHLLSLIPQTDVQYDSN